MADIIIKEKTEMKMNILVLLALGAMALVAAEDPFVGTWKLNVAKSKFEPGPGTKAATVTIAADGKVTVDETDAKDQTTTWSYIPSAKGVAMITGVPDSTVMETRKGNKVEHVWKFGNSNMKGHGEVAKDGKTMTYHMEGTDAEGKKTKSTEFYEKQ
jgi:hypothetical protein